MFAAVLALAALAIVFGLVLGFAAVRFKVESDPVVDKIDAILQTVSAHGKLRFSELFAGEALKREVVCTFLALLE